ncbi:MAG: sulfotransferase, partial [Chloroflexota bacterium]
GAPSRSGVARSRLAELGRRSLGALGGLGTELAYRVWLLVGGRAARLERPIFMIGCPRSGTTVAVELFALHPDVANLVGPQEAPAWFAAKADGFRREGVLAE